MCMVRSYDLHRLLMCKFTQDVKCHDTGACKFTQDVKYHDTGAYKFTRDVKCHDTCHLHSNVWSLARGHVRTKKSTRIISQATRRCSCTGYSSNYFDSAYYMTDLCAYLVVHHIECQTRSSLLTYLLLIHLVRMRQTIKWLT